MPQEDELMEFGSVVTNKGAEKLVNAAKNGKKIDLKYIVIGDGNGECYEPTPEQESLRNLCWQGEITKFEISPDDQKQLIIKGLVPSDVGHFFMREMGVIDTDGDLIAVTNTGEIELVPYSSGRILNMDISLYIQFRTAEIGAVNIVVHPTDQDLFKDEILEDVDSMFRSKFTEMEQSEVEEVFEMSGGGGTGYPEDWVEADESDIDVLFT